MTEALATVTPVLTRPGGSDRPGSLELRTALYQHAFNPDRPAGPAARPRNLHWAQQASLPVTCLSDPAVLRAALEALTFRLDGSRAAANTIIRKRAVLHGALSYAAEARLLPDNPLDNFGWRVPQSSAALDPAVVASPDQVSALLDAVARTRPELTAFFGCLYYAALRPEEAVALRGTPGSGWGMLRLHPPPRPGPPPPGPAPVPATSGAGSSTGRTGRSGWSRSPRCWSPCSVRTMRPTAPHPTGGCSAEPAAGRSANRSTAGPGTPPALSPSAPISPPAGSPGVPTTCATPPCRCG